MRAQLELDGIPRKRVALAPDPEDTVAVSVDMNVDHPVTWTKNGVIVAQGMQIDGEFIAYTDWDCSGQPPQHQGYYQILLEHDGAQGAVVGFYKPAEGIFVVEVDGEQAMLSANRRPWRGLAKPAPLGYSFYVEGCPTRKQPEAPRRRVALEV